MATIDPGKSTDQAILAGRVLLPLLLVVFGYDKLSNYSNTLGYMAQVHAPAPAVAAVVAIVAELGLAVALIGGVFVRTAAILLVKRRAKLALTHF